MNKLLKALFEKSSDQRRLPLPVIQPTDPLGFSWWIITHVASFYQFDRHGAPDKMVRFIFLNLSINTYFW